MWNRLSLISAVMSSIAIVECEFLNFSFSKNSSDYILSLASCCKCDSRFNLVCAVMYPIVIPHFRRFTSESSAARKLCVNWASHENGFAIFLFCFYFSKRNFIHARVKTRSRERQHVVSNLMWFTRLFCCFCTSLPYPLLRNLRRE